MARPLVPDELWDVIQPLLPRHRARPGKRGRPPVDDRACLTGIIFVLQSGIPWEMLPQEMGCGCGMTCWRRLRYWQRRGVWKKLLHALLQRVGQEEASTGSTAAWTARPPAPFLGGADRPEPHGPGQERHQTPPARRRQGHATGRAPHRGQPQRVAGGDEPRGRHPADPRAARSPTAETEGDIWGPPVRHAPESRRPQAAAHRGPPGAAADAAWQRSGQDPLRGRADPGVGRASPPAEDPV